MTEEMQRWVDKAVANAPAPTQEQLVTLRRVIAGTARNEKRSA